MPLQGIPVCYLAGGDLKGSPTVRRSLETSKREVWRSGHVWAVCGHPECGLSQIRLKRAGAGGSVGAFGAKDRYCVGETSQGPLVGALSCQELPWELLEL